MTEFKQQVERHVDSLKKVNWFKTLMSNKILIIGIALLLCLLFMLPALAITTRPSIREQQLDTISNIQSANKQVIPMKETQVSKAFENSKSHIVAIINSKDNSSMSEVDKLLTEKKPLENVTWQVDYIQPIYNFDELAGTYGLTAKNNFIVIEDGKEKGRYSFDTLNGGLAELDEKIIEIIDPKIARTNPKRIEATSSDSTGNEEASTSSSGQRKKTEEVVFE